MNAAPDQQPRVAVVTGGSGGIGAAVSRRLAADGMSVVVHYAGRDDRARAVVAEITGVVEDPSPPKRVHDPKHPLADAQGYVTQSNVNVVEEMVNMISASRSYQNNVEVMNTAQQLMMKTLQMGQ